jgi:hypothetical protein
VGLVSVLRDDLLDGELSSAFDVFAQPHQTETTTTK